MWTSFSAQRPARWAGRVVLNCTARGAMCAELVKSLFLEKLKFALLAEVSQPFSRHFRC
jgi:hypothetical protein